MHQNLSQGSGSIDGLLGKNSIENTQDDPLQKNTQSDHSQFLLQINQQPFPYMHSATHGTDDDSNKRHQSDLIDINDETLMRINS